MVVLFITNRGVIRNKEGKFCKGNYKRNVEQGENTLEIITWK